MMEAKKLKKKAKRLKKRLSFNDYFMHTSLIIALGYFIYTFYFYIYQNFLSTNTFFYYMVSFEYNIFSWILCISTFLAWRFYKRGDLKKEYKYLKFISIGLIIQFGINYFLFEGGNWGVIFSSILPLSLGFIGLILLFVFRNEFGNVGGKATPKTFWN